MGALKLYKHKACKDSAIQIMSRLPNGKVVVRFWLIVEGKPELVDLDTAEITLQPDSDYQILNF